MKKSLLILLVTLVFIRVGVGQKGNDELLLNKVIVYADSVKVLKGSIKDLNGKIKGLNDSIVKINKLLLQSQKQTEKIIKDNTSNNKKYDEQNGQIKKMKAENDSLKNKVIKGHSAQLTQLQKDTASMRKKARELESQRISDNTALAGAQQLTKNAEEKSLMLAGDLNFCRERHKNDSSEVARMLKQQDALNAPVKKLKDDLGKSFKSISNDTLRANTEASLMTLSLQADVVYTLSPDTAGLALKKNIKTFQSTVGWYMSGVKLLSSIYQADKINEVSAGLKGSLNGVNTVPKQNIAALIKKLTGYKDKSLTFLELIARIDEMDKEPKPTTTLGKEDKNVDITKLIDKFKPVFEGYPYLLKILDQIVEVKKQDPNTNIQFLVKDIKSLNLK